MVSGLRAVLDSLRWPDTPEAASAARTWLETRRGARVTVVPRGQPDRWERARADLLVAEGDIAEGADLAGADLAGADLAGADLAGADLAGADLAGADLAGGLIGAGLAYADANEADSLCRPGLRLVEAAARARGLGLWGAARPAAEDGPALREKVGHFVVAEGRIRHVGERGARTYLDFAARGTDGLTVTVSKRTWRMMRARGLSAASLEGRRVRVRGLLEVRRGPTLEVALDGLETLEETDRPEADPEGERGLRR
ncbi:Pentapeptide repeat-containing protein [Methylobacterium sp. 190mf]|uniref:pentapeptide repeat-containing protein n=1 Tax=Methylobacterium sp. 190mf TaxID=1761798 RepID=UPI00089E9C9C|nr:pentapeptide repeat-containing protein [Methylobacterium sp. 190mf]SEG54520.1 Pentapeptide repeat-containing protein [Methylobacterium sp. 190mf]